MIDKEYTDKELCEFASAVSLGAVGSIIESEKPKRIQRKRTKGWKMPENTISVTRPGEWGNPFVVGGWYKLGNGQPGYSWIRCNDEETAKRTGYTKLVTAQQCIEWYSNLLKLYPIRGERLERLRGKNLACWCKPGAPCHADVLLEIANT